MGHRPALLSIIALVLASCGAGATSSESTTTETTDRKTTTVPTTSSPPATNDDGIPEGPSALRDMDDPAFPEPLVDTSQIISGGPPPDGIPPLDNPSFVSVEEADEFLDDEEAVVVLDIEGDARAYPVEILIWHEIVNDTVGDVPVAVTYCPLCNSAVTFRREIRGEETTFGTSGRLFASALVMYDRATESLWTHFDGRAVVGVLAGDRLEPIASPLIAWQDFVAAYPDGKVLSRDTGFRRDYGRNPYVGYDDPDTNPFLFIGSVDERARAKQRVVGVTTGDDAAAFSLDAISGGDAKATNTEVGSTGIVIFWKAGQASALDDSSTADGREIGSVGVFEPVVDGRSLTFEGRNGAFFDLETGSEWNIAGQAVEGELAGESIERIHHLDTFWFAWSTYQPGTELIES